MLGADPSFGWQEAFAAFAIISLAAFLVTWIVTDRGSMPRTPYVAVLTGMTAVLAAVYLAWSGTSLRDLVLTRWGWGLIAGVLAAVVIVPLVRRLPPAPHPEGARLVRQLLWEGVVYGIAEATLLAVLPVLAVWQLTDGLGWPESAWGGLGSGALAVVGAAFVIVVHHLGYREFREPTSRTKLVGVVVVCGIQALAFLLTGNVLAPIVAHVLLHSQLILRGDEMPPVAEAPQGFTTGRRSEPLAFQPREDRLVNR